jgi:hypothetical protein
MTLFAHYLLHQKLVESSVDPVSIKQVVQISILDLKLLIRFTNYETQSSNSSIQEVTDILKKIIVETESFKPDSKFFVFMRTIEQNLGLVRISSIYVAAILFLTFVAIVKSGMSLRKCIALVIITACVLSLFNNYLYLTQVGKTKYIG